MDGITRDVDSVEEIPAQRERPVSPESNLGRNTPVKDGIKSKQKSPGLEDPYIHAPPKPDGDPWAILLKPEMEADKLRCDAWKEEVQTLLIFAGLFSAVVTAFLIESYKFLLPDPNDAIIGLLTQIANGPNTTFSQPNSNLAASFTQTPSSVRINVFWFISLILSLATVLVGTIALQWLREHQSYLGFSAKETFAILHMRSRALKAWHVPQIFAALPLLLQGALALFLAGLIDFTLPLGKKLAIPTACIVGFILLFLIVTTVLPAFQALFLLFGFSPRGTVPTPCAYKSPQSHIFRKVTRYFLYSLSYVWPETYLRETESWKYLANSEKNVAPDKQRHLFPYIYTIWHPKSNAIVDLQWLSLRDAWHNRVLDKDEDLYEHRKEEIRRNVFPLSDITQCLMSAISRPVNAKHTEEFLVAAFYCFEELSASVWSVEWSIKFRIDRRNEYFERLQNLPNGSISTFFLHGGRYQYTGFPDRRTRFETYLYFRRHRPLFHLDQICMFIARLPTLTHLPPTILRRYQLEMKSRIIPYLLKGNIYLLTPTTEVDDSYHIRNLYVPYNESDAGFMSPSASVDTLGTLFSKLISESTAPIYASRVGPTNPLYIHSSIPMVLDMLAGGIIFYLKMVSIETANVSPNAHVQQDLYNVGAAYRSTFFSVAKYLEAHGTSNSDTSLPTPVFYYAALLLHYLFCRLDVIDKDNILPTGSNFSEGFGVLFNAVSECKQRLASRRNDQLEILFEESDLIQSRALGKDEFRDIPRFSDIWWDELFLGYQSLGLCSSQKPPFVATDGVTVPLSEPLPTDIPDSNLISPLSMASSSLLDTVSPSSNTKHPDQDAAPNIRALEIDKGSIRINSRRATASHSRPTSEFLGRDDILRDSTVGISSADSVIDMHPPS